VARRYAELVKASPTLAALIAAETGKLLWETRTEQASMAGKVAVSIAAQAERAGARSAEMPFGSASLRTAPMA
jgi:succinylglutamic semialdehyde dehydrogenase